MSARGLFEALVEGNRERIDELVEAMECEDITWHISEVIGEEFETFLGHEIYIHDHVSEDVVWVNTSMNVVRYYEVKGDVDACDLVLPGAGECLLDAILKHIRHEDVVFDGVSGELCSDDSREGQ